MRSFRSSPVENYEGYEVVADSPASSPEMYGANGDASYGVASDSLSVPLHSGPSFEISGRALAEEIKDNAVMSAILAQLVGSIEIEPTEVVLGLGNVTAAKSNITRHGIGGELGITNFSSNITFTLRVNPPQTKKVPSPNNAPKAAFLDLQNVVSDSVSEREEPRALVSYPPLEFVGVQTFFSVDELGMDLLTAVCMFDSQFTRLDMSERQSVNCLASTLANVKDTMNGEGWNQGLEFLRLFLTQTPGQVQIGLSNPDPLEREIDIGANQLIRNVLKSLDKEVVGKIIRGVASTQLVVVANKFFSQKIQHPGKCMSGGGIVDSQTSKNFATWAMYVGLGSLLLGVVMLILTCCMLLVCFLVPIRLIRNSFSESMRGFLHNFEKSILYRSLHYSFSASYVKGHYGSRSLIPSDDAADYLDAFRRSVRDLLQDRGPDGDGSGPGADDRGGGGRPGVASNRAATPEKPGSSVNASATQRLADTSVCTGPTGRPSPCNRRALDLPVAASSSRRSLSRHDLLSMKNRDELALASYPEIPALISWGLGFMITAATFFYIASNTMVGVALGMSFSHRGFDDVLIPNIFSFSLGNTVSDMCRAKVYLFAMGVLMFSGVWPYLKLLMMLVCFYKRPDGSWFSIGRREKFLEFLDATGKLSLVDTFVLVLFTVAFRMDWQEERTRFGLEVSYGLSFFLFFVATIMSLLLSHLILFLHRHVLNQHIQKAGGNVTKISIRRLARSTRMEDVGVIGSLLVCGFLMIAAMFMPMLTFEFGGAAKVVNQLANTSSERTYSLYTIEITSILQVATL